VAGARRRGAPAEQWLLACRGVAVDAIAAERGRPGPWFEVELDPRANDTALAERTALRVALTAGGAALHLRHRNDVLDPDAAARIAFSGPREVLVGLAEPRRRPGPRS
jgi:hypothetical protein